MAVTWTLLAETAEAGDNRLTLQAPVQWRVNDKVVIATTGSHLSQHENEVRTIESISRNQRTLTLSEPLEYRHLGITGL